MAKTEMIALAQALEAERELRRTVISHVANTATPKVTELASGLESELRKLEINLISLSAKCSRPWSGQVLTLTWLGYTFIFSLVISCVCF